MFSGLHALYLYAFKHTFLVFDQVTPLLQVPVYIQFFPSAILSPDGSGHSLNSHSLRSVLFWLEHQRVPWLCPGAVIWSPRTPHRTELVAIFIPMVYYSERTQSKISKGKRYTGWSPEDTRSRVPNFPKFTPRGVIQMRLIPAAVSCENRWEVLSTRETRERPSVPTFYWIWGAVRGGVAPYFASEKQSPHFP